MKKIRFLSRVLMSAAICFLLAVPCGCGEKTESGSEPSVPYVSSFDVSGSDIDYSETGPVYTIFAGADAINMRDLDAYMATIDPESEVYDITLEDARYMFAHYRLNVSLDNVKVQELDEDSAVISVTQTTLPAEDTAPVSSSDVSASDVSASDVPAPLTGKDYTSRFDPCVTVLTHSMTLIDGRWHITSTVVESYREISLQPEKPVSFSDAVSLSDA